jgi:hypothetical protein
MPPFSGVRLRIGMAPRSQPFDEAMDSLDIAMLTAQAAGMAIKFTKVRRGCPGFHNWGPIMAQAIAEGDTHIFLAADDMLYPPDTIIRLVSADKDIVSGIYRKNMVRELQPANLTESWDEFLEKFNSGGLHETKMAAGHSMTIKRHVIEKMMADYPELAYRVGEETQYALALPMIEDGKCFQDDWAFSIRARRSGFTIWDDYGLRLKHYCYDFLGFEGLEAQNA